jgi:hypothetical protein
LAPAGADAWFDRRDAERFELCEQSVRISENEILALPLFKDEEMLMDVAWPLICVGYQTRKVPHKDLRRCPDGTGNQLT